MTEDGYKARGIIAVCIAILLLIALVGCFIVHPDAVQQGNLNLIIGALIASLTTVVSFYFGSSSGNKALVAQQHDLTSQLAATTMVAATGGAMGDGPTGKPDDPVSVTETPQVATLPPAPPPPPPAPPPEDPRLVAFRKQMRAIQPKVSDASILAAWKEFSAVDVDLP